MKSARKYAVVAPTSLGIRIAPEQFGQVQTSNMFFLQATSAESNVLSIPAALGLPVKALAKFMSGDPVSEFVRRDIQSRGIICANVYGQRVDPWGDRHPCNIAENGFGLRGPHVNNDRAGEIGRTVSADDFEPDKLFGEDGVEILHISGLICALSESSARCCKELAKKAKRYGASVCFDTNYRASLWKGREAELLSVFDEIAELSDILLGGDMLLIEKHKAEPIWNSERTDEEKRIEDTKLLLRKVHEEYKNAKVCISTMREVISVNCHKFGAVALENGEFTVMLPRPMPVYDRIGGGDAFVGGFLYSTVKEWGIAKRLDFGCGCAAFVSGLADDYGLPPSEQTIFDLQAEDAWTSR